MVTTSHILFNAQAGVDDFAAIEPQLLMLGRFVSTGRWYIDPLQHDFYTISYVQQGHATVTVEGESHHVHPGSVLMYSPNVSYHAHNDEPYMDYHTLIYRFTTGNDTPLPTTFAQSTTLMLQRLLGMIHKQALAKPIQHRVIKTLLLEVLELAYTPGQVQTQHPQATQVTQAMQLIREYLHEPFSLTQLAERLSISPSHLSHLFKQHADTSAGAYYLSLKMDKAKAMLCDTTHSLKHIADKMGYTSIHHFTRRFTAVVGLPPGEFRKQQQAISTQRIKANSDDGGPVV
ncbi:MAG TPA: hypothetical protein DER01_18935 [Phycisphaerales bacterium]|nr:hypothetical protein [Phycisphaerales bacterium]|tara:strand:+ start:184 stop:1047 length:864 start_codon:yes stop_codon:yes gene_type:complete